MTAGLRRPQGNSASRAVWRAIRVTWSRVSAGLAEASMPMTRRGRPPAAASAAKPATMPAWVLPVTEHTTIVSKNTPSSRAPPRRGDVGRLLSIAGPAAADQPAMPAAAAVLPELYRRPS
jgi:hypothetical protein